MRFLGFSTLVSVLTIGLTTLTSKTTAAVALRPRQTSPPAPTISCPPRRTFGSLPQWDTAVQVFQNTFYIDYGIVVRDSAGRMALPINRKKPVYPVNDTQKDPPTLGFYSCKSQYMGWNKTSGPLGPGFTQKIYYGQLKSVKGRCVTAQDVYAPAGSPRPFVLDTCYTADDDNLLKQWFKLNITYYAETSYYIAYGTNEITFVGKTAYNTTAATHIFTNATLAGKETVQVAYLPQGGSTKARFLLEFNQY